MIGVGSYCCSSVDRPVALVEDAARCCAVPRFRFFGFGIGVMNSARGAARRSGRSAGRPRRAPSAAPGTRRAS